MTSYRFPHIVQFSLVVLLGVGLAAAPALAQTSPGQFPAPQSPAGQFPGVQPHPVQSRPATAPTTAAPAANDTPGQGKVVEDVVARVNDQIITESDYQRALQQLEAEGRQQGASQQEIDQQKKDLLRDLIDQQLLLAKGKELGITGETELVRRLDDIRKQNHLDTMEDLEKAAQQQGVSYEDFKANVRNGIIRQQVVRDEVVKRMPHFTEADVERYYKEHEAEFAKPESVHLGEILIPTSAPGAGAGAAPEPAQLAAAQAKADEIEAKLKAGADFSELAKTASSGPTAAQGGDLGDFRRGMLAKELEDKTFSLQAGQFTEPIRTKQGFVILKVLDHTQGGDAGFKAVEPQVEDALFSQAMQPALRSYLTQQREEAYVEVKPGFVDSGASPNETRPVYSAYVPPTKKKKTERTRFRQRGRYAGTSKTAVASTATPAAGAAGAAATPSTAAASSTGTGASAETTPAATTTTETATTAAPAGAASALPAPSKSRTKQVASNKVQKPGKREKIRFGQAPRESLPASSTPLNGDATQAAAAGQTAEPTQTAANETPAPPLADDSAAVSTSNVRVVNPDGSIPPTEPQVQEKKTRFSDRARSPEFKHAKQKAKAAAAAEQAANQPTPDEKATQQVQQTPLGLAGDTSKPAKKPKQKGEKTRYADQPHPAAPEPVPNQPSNTVPAPGSSTAPTPVPGTAPRPAPGTAPNPAPTAAPATAPGPAPAAAPEQGPATPPTTDAAPPAAANPPSGSQP